MKEEIISQNKSKTSLKKIWNALESLELKIGFRMMLRRQLAAYETLAYRYGCSLEIKLKLLLVLASPPGLKIDLKGIISSKSEKILMKQITS